jgi:hypothetical protein
MDLGEIPGFWYGMSPFLLHDGLREALLECMYGYNLHLQVVHVDKKSREAGDE